MERISLCRRHGRAKPPGACWLTLSIFLALNAFWRILKLARNSYSCRALNLTRDMLRSPERRWDEDQGSRRGKSSARRAKVKDAKDAMREASVSDPAIVSPGDDRLLFELPFPISLPAIKPPGPRVERLDVGEVNREGPLPTPPCSFVQGGRPRGRDKSRTSPERERRVSDSSGR